MLLPDIPVLALHLLLEEIPLPGKDFYDYADSLFFVP